MKHPTGILYFSEMAAATSQLQLLYAFTGVNGSGLYNSKLSKPEYSGSIYGTGNFYSRSGSGFFDGNTIIKINNASGFSSDTSWTMVITYEHSGRNSHNVLFSNYSSGADGINSGFALGAANTLQPYLEYYTNVGPKIILSENNWGNKNTIFLTKNTNSITVEYFNYNSHSFESELFNVNDTYFLPANDWRIGGATGTPNCFSGNNFQGYIDTFLYYSPGLQYEQKILLASGLYSSVGQSLSGITSRITSGITGYVTGLMRIFTGYTGQSVQLLGYSPALCSGGQIAQYGLVDVSGSIYESYVSGLFQTNINYFTGYSGISISGDGEYRKTFHMDATSYLKDVDSNDISELYCYSGIDKTNFNNILVYDRVLDMFILPNNHNLNDVNFYLNGVAQFGSGYSVSGNLYNTVITSSGAFYISGNYLSGNEYADSDSNIIDYISGNQRKYIDITGLTTGLLSSGLNSGYIFFINGIKIINNISINDLNYITGNITGKVFSLPLESGYGFYSGYNNVITSGFSRGTSNLYLNGCRQKINFDYVEIGGLSLLNSGSNYFSRPHNIYNNENNFISYL